eukprot:scaffold336_cov250-Pinguiococcus_pyrenoidosus.AAC.31
MQSTRRTPRTPRSDGKVVMRGPLLQLRADIEQANIAKHAALEAEQRLRQKLRRLEEDLAAKQRSAVDVQKQLSTQREAGWTLVRTSIGAAMKIRRLRKENHRLEASNSVRKTGERACEYRRLTRPGVAGWLSVGSIRKLTNAEGASLWRHV